MTGARHASIGVVRAFRGSKSRRRRVAGMTGARLASISVFRVFRGFNFLIAG
jgi:hypothetical protein